MSITIPKPKSGDYPEYFSNYVNFFNDEIDVIGILEQNELFLSGLIANLDEEKLNWSYQEGKWSIKEIIIHLMDAERIFLTRALRIARNDKVDLPGFDQDDFAPFSGAKTRTKGSILSEYQAVRTNTLEFFKNIDQEALERRGSANGSPHTVAAIAFQIAGHEQHHIKVLQERYL